MTSFPTASHRIFLHLLSVVPLPHLEGLMQMESFSFVLRESYSLFFHRVYQSWREHLLCAVYLPLLARNPCVYFVFSEYHFVVSDFALSIVLLLFFAVKYRQSQ